MVSRRSLAPGLAAMAIVPLCLLFCGCQSAPPARQPPVAPIPAQVRLKDDAVYAEKLRAALAGAPAEGAALKERFAWHLNVAHTAFDARAYEVAANHCRLAIDMCPDWDILHANYSVYLGKLGRYKEAETAASNAVALNGEGTMHANLVLASWEWHLDKRQQALDRVKRVTEPTDPEMKPLYHGCLACFYASVGDEVQVEKAMKTVLEADKAATARAFFMCDMVFDSYRGKPWFVKLVGETLAGKEAGK